MVGDCTIVRRGGEHEGAQGLAYALGVTSATTRTRGLCLTTAELPPGRRSACHLHRDIESAGYVVSGTLEFWWGAGLENYAVLQAGDFAHIPADVPHVVGTPPDSQAVIVVAHSSASDQDGIELLPGLDQLLDAESA
jgi:uncharacterized RmlC-like cupin family protein